MITHSSMKAALRAIAERVCWVDDEDFNASDYAGDDVNGAYWAGLEDGQTQLARKLLRDGFLEDE